MDTSFLLTALAWSWVIAGLVSIGSIVFMVFENRGIYTYTWRWVLNAWVVTGAIVATLCGLGLPESALWSWRIVAGLLVLVGGVTSLTAAHEGGSRTIAIVMTLLNAGLFAMSFVANPLARFTSSGRLAAGPIRVIQLDGVQLWHSVALAMLAIGTVLFLGLAVRMIERGVSAQIESHWGGLGGGLGGWRVSASLTYLVAATIFGVLFAFFVLQLESPGGSTGERTEVAGQPPE